MAERSGLFNTATGNARTYNDVDFATIFSLFTGGCGYVVGYGNELKVYEDGGQIKVDIGAAWLGDPAGWLLDG